MKREIKFRGLTVSGDWVYGLLAKKGKDWFISNSVGMPFSYQVQPQTVGQFTGLKDKNGKEIYEEDIVRVYGQFEIPCDDKKDFEIITYEHIGTVTFENGCFVFKNHLSKEKLLELQTIFEDSALDTDITSSIDSFTGVEILGNIYENPELLK